MNPNWKAKPFVIKGSDNKLYKDLLVKTIMELDPARDEEKY